MHPKCLVEPGPVDPHAVVAVDVSPQDAEPVEQTVSIEAAKIHALPAALYLQDLERCGPQRLDAAAVEPALLSRDVEEFDQPGPGVGVGGGCGGALCHLLLREAARMALYAIRRAP